MTDSKERVLEALRDFGLSEARRVREEAVKGDLDGTGLIAAEGYIPLWSRRDYRDIPIGSPYRHEGQVYRLWQQHDATEQPDWSPDKAFSLWDICHTTDPAAAKPYLPPQGSRGLYRKGECMLWTDGKVYRSIIENNDYTPEERPQDWEEIAGRAEA